MVIGPEAPLVDGLTDFLEKKQVKVFGPSSYAAQLEEAKFLQDCFVKGILFLNQTLNFILIQKLQLMT